MKRTTWRGDINSAQVSKRTVQAYGALGRIAVALYLSMKMFALSTSEYHGVESMAQLA